MYYKFDNMPNKTILDTKSYVIHVNYQIVNIHITKCVNYRFNFEFNICNYYYHTLRR